MTQFFLRSTKKLHYLANKIFIYTCFLFLTTTQSLLDASNIPIHYKNHQMLPYKSIRSENVGPWFCISLRHLGTANERLQVDAQVRHSSLIRLRFFLMHLRIFSCGHQYRWSYCLFRERYM